MHYQMVKNLMEGKIRQFVSLPNCNHLLACHLKVTQDMETGNIISIDPNLTGQLINDVPAMFGEIYILRPRQKGGRTKYMLSTVTKGHLKARSNLSGKMHLLPDEVENDYEALMGYLRKAPEAETKSGTKTKAVTNV